MMRPTKLRHLDDWCGGQVKDLLMAEPEADLSRFGDEALRDFLVNWTDERPFKPSERMLRAIERVEKAMG